MEEKKKVQKKTGKKAAKKKANPKVLTIISVLVVIALIIGIVVIVNKNSRKGKETPDIAQVLSNTTQTSQENINLKDVAIQSGGSNMIVKGKVENKAEAVKSMKLTFYVYNESHQIKGEAFTKVENLNKNATSDFTISIMGDYSDLKQYEVKVEEVAR